MLRKPPHCPVPREELVDRPGGKRCLRCEKFIKDFTRHRWEEIERIQGGPQGPYCGIFTSKQIQHWFEEKPASSLDRWRIWQQGLAFSSALLFPGLMQHEPASETHAVCLPHEENPGPKVAHLQAQAPLQGTRVLSGMVRDSASTEPLIGVSIWVPAWQKGVVSDEKGEFTLQAPDEWEEAWPLELHASYFAYKDFIIQVGKDQRQPLTIMLPETRIPMEVFYIEHIPWHRRLWGRIKRMFR